MALQDYYNRHSPDKAGDGNVPPEIPIKDALPLEEWVVVKSRHDGRKRYVNGEDYDGNWIVEFREQESGRCRVAVYPPDHNPDHGHHPEIGWTSENRKLAEHAVNQATGASGVTVSETPQS